ncbi:unnamed protein product [Rotaria sordida]|uniref:Fibronectin type-III domain-containing protein n=1 Tax=Rotaria sordida TaxID=392033 RepID=A0A814TL12_9BILA|nr:unnamed protein product [Rotaria sordida]CAF1406598.1 unnamed protein product [Rotaria sordida]
MIILLLFVLICSTCINATHFYGGTITWMPIDSYTNSSSVDITITQTYSWSYPVISCTTNVPVSSGRSNTNLTCIANCSNDGGYSNAPISILTDCTSYSDTLGTISSTRSINITLNASASFYIAYTGSSWRNLYSASTSGLSWSVVSLINLHLRSDGIINTPPVSNVLSPQYVIENTTTLIDIPISDVNIGDNVRCRWAVNQGSGSIDECSSICYSSSLPSGTTLSNCTLSFTGLVPNTCYPVALQVEDFINKTSTDPMSSVPVQFLICVKTTPSCTILPVIISLTDCLNVQVGVTTNFTLYIMNLCNSSATITEVIISQAISSMTVGTLTNSTTNTSLSYISLTWTPQSSQIGTQELCVYAYNSLLVRSTQYCATFTVTASSASCSTTTVAGVSTTIVPRNNGINIPLIVGLSLLGLSLALCCCGCWLYNFFCGPAGRRRREGKQMEEIIGQQKSSQLLPSFITRNLPFKIMNNNYLFYKMPNNQDNTSSLGSSPPTSLLIVPKNEILFTNSEIGTNHNLDQLFTHENIRQNTSHHHNNNITKVPRNKVSTVCNSVQLNDSQTKDRNSNISAANSIIENITIEDVDASIHHNESVNVIKRNGDGTLAAEKNQIKKVNTPAAGKQRGVRLIKTKIGRPSITRRHSSKISSITVTRVTSLSNNDKTRRSNETTAVHGDDEGHTNNIINTTSISHKKSKTRSYRSRHRKINVNVMN